MILKLFLIISLLLFTACSLDRTKPIEDCAPVIKWKSYDCGIPPSRDHIDLGKFDSFWVVDENGLWTLTPEHYAMLGEAMAKVLDGSSQLKELVSFYENCVAANAH